jgi:hypothetical protein
MGLAGEYAVASELSRRGWVATLLPAGSRDFDIVAMRPDLDRVVLIQVKTASPNRRAFQLKTAHEAHTDQTNQWFAFVSFPNDQSARPRFHLAPRNAVAAILWAIRCEAEARGQEVGPWRNFLTDWLDDSCCDNWDALLTPTDQARGVVRAQETGFVQRFGRPEDQAVLAQV